MKIKTITSHTELDEKMKQFVYNKLSNIFLKENGYLDCNKILFINPPDGDHDMFNYTSAKSGRYTNFAPYGLGIVSKHLKSLGYETKILNLNHHILKKVSELDEDEFDYKRIIFDELSKELNDFKPDLIGLTCMFSMTHKSLKNVSEVIKKITNVPVAVGGVHISNSIWNENTREQLIKDLNHIDLFFLFEAELSFSEFINSINSDFNGIENYKQLIIRDDNQSIFFSSRKRPEGENLNIIPEHDVMQSSELSNFGKVGNFNFLINKKDRITTILSNRGCRAQCTFCSVRNFNGKKIRTRSIQSIIDELLFLRDYQNIKHVMWLDDDLLYNTGRTIELFNEMVKQDVGITWDASNGVIAASVKDEIMSAAEESGCLGVVIGMESGNPKILKEIRKPGTVDIFIRAAEVLKRYPKINSRVFLMIGFPNETYQQILDTINVSRQMNMDWNYITPLQPLPNTPIFDDMVEDNLAGTEAFGDIKNIKIIWAFMNYYLNFEPLLKINQKDKIDQNYKWMNYVSDVVAKNDPIAIYYKMIMQKKHQGFYEKMDVDRYKNIIDKSSHWKNNISQLGLSDIST